MLDAARLRGIDASPQRNCARVVVPAAALLGAAAAEQNLFYRFRVRDTKPWPRRVAGVVALRHLPHSSGTAVRRKVGAGRPWTGRDS